MLKKDFEGNYRDRWRLMEIDRDWMLDT